MTVQQLARILTLTGYPVAYRFFPVEEAHEPPFICYIITGYDNFSADNIVYDSHPQIQIELYTPAKDPEAEGIVETLLTNNGLYFLKLEGYLDDEQMEMVTYRVTL